MTVNAPATMLTTMLLERALSAGSLTPALSTFCTRVR